MATFHLKSLAIARCQRQTNLPTGGTDRAEVELINAATNRHWRIACICFCQEQLFLKRLLDKLSGCFARPQRDRPIGTAPRTSFDTGSRNEIVCFDFLPGFSNVFFDRHDIARRCLVLHWATGRRAASKEHHSQQETNSHLLIHFRTLCKKMIHINSKREGRTMLPFEVDTRQLEAMRSLPLQCPDMFAARPFTLNTAPAVLASAVARASTTKTTTIKG